MEDYLEKLNNNQFRAVTTAKKNVLVMSGAGSGKTRVLTTRIRYLVDRGIEATNIAAFTFTNKAALEMKIRFNKMARNNSYGEIMTPTISTFHSFCYSFLLISDWYLKLGYTKIPDIVTDTVKSKIIKNILSRYDKRYSNIPFITAISKIKNKVKVTELNDSETEILNSVYHSYQKELKSSNMIDFDDMVPLFLKLCEDPIFNDLVQYQFILIDECQDINQIQYELIKTISRRYGNVFMVGDEDQLIYSFRNSNIEILNNFKEKADEVIILNQNYRWSKNILEHANKLIDFNNDRLKKNLFSDIDSKKKVVFKEFTSTTDEAISVAIKIKDLIDDGVNPKDIAVLYRNNNQSYPIEKELNNRKIPYTLYGGKPLFEYIEIQVIIYLYRLVIDPTNELAAKIIFERLIDKPGEGLYESFMRDYKSQTKNFAVFASGYALKPKIQKFGFSLLKLMDEYNTLTKENFFDEVLTFLHFNKYLKETYKQKTEYEHIMALKDFILDTDTKDLEESFNQMVLEKPNTNEITNSTVSLLTIHKAKGLEFKVVFVIGFNQGILPGYNRQGLDLEEERRLAYVAMTRAKDELYLYCSIVHFINGTVSKLRPSSFLIEAGITYNDTHDFFDRYWYNH